MEVHPGTPPTLEQLKSSPNPAAQPPSSKGKRTKSLCMRFPYC
uniref:Uncharacterized protein n=1 Tax=Vibrio tasmaniensis TaxID=212663 RepID=A0A0H3ZJ35_9VIBR|nr:hypothetical protein [Vibrio tasmaniensis]